VPFAGLARKLQFAGISDTILAASWPLSAPVREADLPPPDFPTMLRCAFAVARRAGERGDHPFGALLVGPDGTILLQQGNCFASDGNDRTAHAERLLATRAAKSWGAAFLAGCTLVSSAEPCAMCAGAIYWAGIGRVVYGLGEKRLGTITGAHGENPTLDLPCRTVFGAGRRAVEVVGPLLEDEAAALHDGFWNRR
jgi:tRNA(Arg) A34 adenosine deaminase TadA